MLMCVVLFNDLIYLMIYYYISKFSST